MPSLYAIGAFIQGLLLQNPRIPKRNSRELGSEAHVYVGTGLGSLDTIYTGSIALYKSQIRWDAFWAACARNSELRCNRDAHPDAPSETEPEEWNRFWAARSPELQEYLAELAEIDSLSIHDGVVETAKLHPDPREGKTPREIAREVAPRPIAPERLSADIIWNIHNMPASQISILGGITGLAFAPVAACSTFGVALGLAARAINRGKQKLVVSGGNRRTAASAYDRCFLQRSRALCEPHRIGPSHRASRALTSPAVPSCGFSRITSILQSKGFKPVGMEPVGVGLSSDAHHIITPSVDGPKAAIHQAMANAGATPGEIGTWDLHATATPGDYSEVATLSSILPDSVLITARKGTFGHGMSAGSGWELTAQYMGYEQGKLFPTVLTAGTLNGGIAGMHDCFVFEHARDFPSQAGGKLSMGIGGINACIISRPWLPRTP